MAVAVPPAPVQVRVYEVETEGETLPLPVAPPEGPPLLTEQLVALLAFHDSVVDWPLATDAGIAEKELIVGGTAMPLTLTVTLGESCRLLELSK